VIPAPDQPLTRVWAEADDPAEAARLADRFAALVAEAVEHDEGYPIDRGEGEEPGD
jgi:hypothetical protein